MDKGSTTVATTSFGQDLIGYVEEWVITMYFSRPLVKGTLIRRLNRFVAEVEVSDKLELAHVPNTGRLRELLVEGATVFLTPMAGGGRQTHWDLTLVQKDALLCAIDTRLPSQLLLESETHKILELDSSEYKMKLEAPYGNHRFDLLAEGPQGQVWVEAKSVSLVVDRQAYFPDAPTERGTSHLRTLTDLMRAGDRGAMVFLLLRNDADVVRPNEQTDPQFAEALRRAAEAGVMVRAIRYHVTLQGVFYDQEVPVVY